MSMTRRSFLSLILLLGIAVPAFAAGTDASQDDIRKILAPTGELRAALYTGTPTSVVGPDDLRGVGYDLGKALALKLAVPYKPIVFPKNADVLDAIKAGTADVAFTNASAERARDMDFTQPYIAIELGYLASAGTPVAGLADVDRAGVRVGVTANSSSDGFLTSHLKQATVVRATTFDAGIQLMSSGALDVYATNKATLFEMADKLPGSRVLDGGWGAERHGIAIPKGRDMALPYLRAFVHDMVASGAVAAAVTKAGLRGTLPEEPQP